MELQSLKVNLRQAEGKGGARQTRREGAVPGVLYGGEQAPVTLKMDVGELRRLISSGGEHAVVQLEVQDDPALNSPALIKSVQHHPVNGKIIHADFFRIRLDRKITTMVPITVTGQAQGVVEGGVMDIQMREVEVECLALEVPHEIVVDVTALAIGDSIHVSDLNAPENVTITSDSERPVVAVHAPRIVKEEVPAEGEEVEAEATAEEPEVIGEKTEEKEEDKDAKKKEK